MILGWFLELVSRIRFVTGPDFSRAVQPELQCWKRLTAGGGGATRLKEYKARWTTKVLWPIRPRLGLDTIKLRVHQRRNRFSTPPANTTTVRPAAASSISDGPTTTALDTASHIPQSLY